MTHNKKIIVAIGLFVPGTGFTRVLSSLFEELRHYYEIHWIGIGYTGERIDRGYYIYPNNINGGDAYGAYFGRDLILELGAEFALILNDFWILKNYHKVFNTLPNEVKTIAYVPLDGKIDNAEDIMDSSFLDHIILYTSFAELQTKSAFNKLLKKSAIEKYPNLTSIPHGVDLTEFKVLPKNIAKNLCFKKFVQRPGDSIFILNANRLAERKGINHTIHAFAQAREKFNLPAYLVLHNPGSEKNKLNHLRNFISDLDISQNVILNPFGDENYVSDEQLNLLYNACDIGINSSYGEGWGLISFEHGATKAAQIVPKHTACQELWNKYGILTKTCKDVVFETNPFTMSEVDKDHLEPQMIKLVNNENYRKKYSLLAYQNANNPKYQWNNIAREWKKIFR